MPKVSSLLQHCSFDVMCTHTIYAENLKFTCWKQKKILLPSHLLTYGRYIVRKIDTKCFCNNVPLFTGFMLTTFTSLMSFQLCPGNEEPGQLTMYVEKLEKIHKGDTAFNYDENEMTKQNKYKLNKFRRSLKTVGLI